MTPVFIFDIGNVLIDFDLAGLQQRIAEESGVPYATLRAHWSSPDLLAVETGKLSGPAFFQRFLRAVPVPWDYEAWIRAWMGVYEPNVLGQTLFADLRARGYPVCVLSNLAEYNTAAIERKFPGFFGRATRSFFSYEIGFHKPDPRIYFTACRSLLVDPGDCVFLDDFDENVAGARRAGMRGYVFSTAQFAHLQRAIQEITGV